jgi:hypothetical protein
MSRIFSVALGCAAACALTARLWAQAPAGQGGSANRDARDFVVIGCVSAEAARAGGAGGGPGNAPRFQITDSRTKTETYRLDGDPSQLEFHVGHTVEVVGPVTEAPGARGGSSPPPTLKVKSLVYISTSCSR